VHGANGSVGNPSFAFLSDQSTGLYRISLNNIGVAANGNKVLDIATTGLTVTGALGASSLTSPASTNLTLTSGLVGTNKVNFPDTLSASSATVGAVTIGNGTAATNVAIGGGNINAGGTGTFGGNILAAGTGVNAIGGIGARLIIGGALDDATFDAIIQGGRIKLVGGNSNINSSGNIYFDAGGGGSLQFRTGIVNVVNTTSASSSTVGALTIGNGTAATNVAIGGGNINAGGTLTVGGTSTFAGAVTTSSTTLSGAGAIPITTSLVKFTSTAAANALTLANGVDGQRLTIVHDVKGTLGTGVLTPTTKTGFSTVTFTNAGDTVSLVYVTTRGWMVTGSYLATIAP
jgi:hypothetical protein